MLEARFSVRRGDFRLEAGFSAEGGGLGIFGPSGSGKSTLLECLAGLQRPDEGAIVLDGVTLFSSRDGVDVPPERRGVAYVFQDAALFPHLTVRGNLLYGARRPGPEVLSFDEVVDLLDLGEVLDRRPGGLSGGEGRRVALGRALLSRPRMLVLDEPLTGLDEGLRRRILPYLIRVRDRLPLPTVFVSHVLAEVLAMADRILVLDRGRQVALGEPRHVLHDPAVFPVAEATGLENVVVAAVREHRPEEGLTLADWGGRTLALPLLEAPPGRVVRAALRASDVVLASGDEASSARNRLAGRIHSVDRSGCRMLVRADLGDTEFLVAEVTPGAASEMGLAPGMEVTLVVKATSFRVLG